MVSLLFCRINYVLIYIRRQTWALTDSFSRSLSLLSPGPAVPDQPDEQPDGRRPGGALVSRHCAGRLQQPHLWHAGQGGSGQDGDLGPDRVPEPLESRPLHGAAAQAAGAGASAGAAEPQGVGADGGHGGSHEGQAVPGAAAEEPGSPGDLLRDGRFLAFASSSDGYFCTFESIFFSKIHLFIYTCIYLCIVCAKKYCI